MKSKNTKKISGREEHRRFEQSRSQWERNNANAAFGLNQLMNSRDTMITSNKIQRQS